MRPCAQPAGHTQGATREAKKKVRGLMKRSRSLSRNSNVEYQLKKARVIGMQVHVEEIVVNTNQTQILNLWEKTDVYKLVHGE